MAKKRFLNDPQQGRRGKWQGWAEQARMKPGKWFTSTSTVWESDVSDFRRGRNPAFPRGEFEFQFVMRSARGTNRSGLVRLRALS